MTRKTSDYDTLMIGALLAIPTQVIGRRVAAALAEQGFTDYRLTYQPVFQWCRPEGSRLTELAERVGITRQSMGEIIDVLEQRGYVERVPDPTDGGPSWFDARHAAGRSTALRLCLTFRAVCF